ncbi:hypothetical protein KSF78_0008575 [Schistosoma japonicum]|nr:hypothetical protein KSF78_0008575 [Schistosoma japonicum]
MNVSEWNSSMSGGHESMEAVRGIVSMECRSRTSSRLNDTYVGETLIRGYRKLNITRGPSFRNVTVHRLTIPATTPSQETTSYGVEYLSTDIRRNLSTSTTLQFGRTDVHSTQMYSTTTLQPQVDDIFLCQIKALIQFSRSSEEVQWSDDLMDNTSVLYNNISVDIRSQINNVVQSLGFQTILYIQIINIQFTKLSMITCRTNCSPHNNNTVVVDNTLATITLNLKLRYDLMQQTDNEITSFLKFVWIQYVKSTEFILHDIEFSRAPTSIGTSTGSLERTDTSVSREMSQSTTTTGMRTPTSTASMLVTTASSPVTSDALEISVFEIDILIYIEELSVPMNWSSDLLNQSSTMYRSLSTSICNLLVNGLRLGNEEIFRDARCLHVVFIRTIIWMNVSEWNSSMSGGHESMEAVRGIVSMECRSRTSSRLNDTYVGETLIRGYRKLNITRGPSFRNVTVHHIFLCQIKALIQFSRSSEEVQWSDDLMDNTSVLYNNISVDIRSQIINIQFTKLSMITCRTNCSPHNNNTVVVNNTLATITLNLKLRYDLMQQTDNEITSFLKFVWIQYVKSTEFILHDIEFSRAPTSIGTSTGSLERTDTSVSREMSQSTTTTGMRTPTSTASMLMTTASSPVTSDALDIFLCQIKALIQFSRSSEEVQWSDDLMDNTSVLYNNISVDIRSQIINVVQSLGFQTILYIQIINIQFTKLSMMPCRTNCSPHNNNTVVVNNTLATITLNLKLRYDLMQQSDNEITSFLKFVWIQYVKSTEFILHDIEFSRAPTSIGTSTGSLERTDTSVSREMSQSTTTTGMRTPTSTASMLVTTASSPVTSDALGNKLVNGLRLGNEEIFRDARCLHVVFIRTIIWMNVSEWNSSMSGGHESMEAVRGIVSMECRSRTSSRLNDTYVGETLIRGYRKLNITRGPSFRNVTVHHIFLCQIKALIQFSRSSEEVQWSDDLMDNTSVLYNNISVDIRSQIINIQFTKLSMMPCRTNCSPHNNNTVVVNNTLATITLNLKLRYDLMQQSDNEITSFLKFVWIQYVKSTEFILHDIEFSRAPTSIGTSTGSLERTDTSVSREMSQSTTTTGMRTPTSTASMLVTTASSPVTSDALVILFQLLCEYYDDYALLLVEISVFEIDILIYIEELSVPMNWSSDLLNQSSTMYRSLSTSICNLLVNGLRLGNEEIFRDARCLHVVFIRTIIWMNVSEWNSSMSGGHESMEAVRGIVSMECRSRTSSRLNDTYVGETLIRGYRKLNITRGPSFRNVTVHRLTIPATTPSQETTSYGVEYLSTDIRRNLSTSTTLQFGRTDVHSTQMYSTTTLQPQVDDIFLCQIKALIQFSRSSEEVQWSDDLMDNTSVLYNNISVDIRSQRHLAGVTVDHEHAWRKPTHSVVMGTDHEGH